MITLLDIECLENIIDAITEKVYSANRMEKLNNLLTDWGLTNLIKSEPLGINDFYDTYKDGKIVVIGASQIKENDMLGIAKSLGLDKNRFEFCLDYDKIQSFQFSKMQYNPNYRLVIVGPMPHSIPGKGKSQSIISEMEKGNGYPKVVRPGSNRLKFTKTNFKQALQELQNNNYI